jgi:hypothetical protein
VVADPELGLLLERTKQLMEDVRDLKDGQGVLTGIAIRLEGATQGMTLELRAMRSQLDRLSARHEDTRTRVLALEDAQTPR